jgi:hypothetical protein
VGECTCIAAETMSECECPCDYCAEFCPPYEDECEVEEEGCLDCGVCWSCVQRAIDYAEEMAAEEADDI